MALGRMTMVRCVPRSLSTSGRSAGSRCPEHSSCGRTTPHAAAVRPRSTVAFRPPPASRPLPRLSPHSQRKRVIYHFHLFGTPQVSSFFYSIFIRKILNFILDLALVLFGLGAIGFVFNRNNLILMIISIEIILLAVSVMTLFFS